MENIFEGEFVNNRVIVYDSEVSNLYFERGYGKPVTLENPNHLELDLIKAAYLLEKGLLKI